MCILHPLEKSNLFDLIAALVARLGPWSTDLSYRTCLSAFQSKTFPSTCPCHRRRRVGRRVLKLRPRVCDFRKTSLLMTEDDRRLEGSRYNTKLCSLLTRTLALYLEHLFMFRSFQWDLATDFSLCNGTKLQTDILGIISSKNEDMKIYMPINILMIYCKINNII